MTGAAVYTPQTCSTSFGTPTTGQVFPTRPCPPFLKKWVWLTTGANTADPDYCRVDGTSVECGDL